MDAHGGDPSANSPRPILLCYETTGVLSSNGIWIANRPFDYIIPLFLAQIIVIFAISRFTYAILKRTGQPQIISHIIAGIILGPSVLCHHQPFQNLLFPVRSWIYLDIISILACMIFIFVVGIKTDLNIVRISRRKAFAIAQVSFVFPFIFSIFATLFVKRPSDFGPKFGNLPIQISARWALTSNSVLACMLEELNLLTTKLGRLALSASLIADLQHFVAIMIVSSGLLGMITNSPAKGLTAFLAFVLFTCFILFIARPLAMWMVKMTPEGGTMDEAHFLAILLMALGSGLVGELLGHDAMLGPLMLGLALPGGPPLGTTISDRIDRFVSGLLLPIYMAMTGLKMDLRSLVGSEEWGFYSVLIGSNTVAKFGGVVAACLHFRMPFRNAVVVGLMMSCRGIVELHTISTWHDSKIMDKQVYALTILWTVGVGGLSAGLLKIVYKPSVRFATNKRRTIQHAHRTTELRVMVCVYHAENVLPLVSLLDASHSTNSQYPFGIYLLHLVPLVGHTTATLAPYRNKKRRKWSMLAPASTSSTSDTIVNAFRSLEQNLDTLSIFPFIGTSPYVTMHEDICTLASDKRTVLIILPFHKHITNGIQRSNTNIQTVNLSVLQYAPCSVAILINHEVIAGLSCSVNASNRIAHRVTIFFLGGADDREALAYGLRMADNPTVGLTVIRILPLEELRVEREEERFDEESVKKFKEILEDKRVVYKEEVSNDGAGTLELLKGICKNCELLIIGRRHGKASMATAGLEEWSEYPELGVIGDLMATAEFGVKVSTLVVQQQVRVKEGMEAEESE